jgi:phage-related minor tail protein
MAESIFGEEFQREISDLDVELGRIRDLAEGVGDTIANAFRRAIIDGRSLNAVLADVARRFADIALKAALKPVGLMISGFLENLFAGANPALGAVPFAKGGVINAPSYFPAGLGRLGVMGEAGPEAILPLMRGADGRLGIGGAQAVTVNMTVQASDAPSFLRAEAEVSAMLLRAVRRGSRAS